MDGVQLNATYSRTSYVPLPVRILCIYGSFFLKEKKRTKTAKLPIILKKRKTQTRQTKQESKQQPFFCEKETLLIKTQITSLQESEETYSGKQAKKH